MLFVNDTKNTVYLQDIDRHIPYQDGAAQEIDSDSILKSSGFQKLVILGEFRIIEIGNSRIEKNLKRTQEKIFNLKEKMEKAKSLAPAMEEKMVEKTEQTEVIVKGHFLEGGGYAKVNRNLALGLHEAGAKVNIEVVGNGKADLTPEESKKLGSLNRDKLSRNAIRLDSIVPTFSNMSSGRKKILYTTVESYTVPEQFLDSLKMYHEIWVTSDFCKDVLREAGVERDIFVLPDSLDVNHYVPEGDKYEFRPALKPFVFTSVFGWSYRKGYDVLLQAYLEEFTEEDPVSLLLVSKYQNNSKRSDVIKNTVNDFIQKHGGSQPAHIARCSRSIPESEMPSLYRASDAFVLFPRGEGFCTLPESEIKTEQGLRQIKDIKEGDLVYSHRGFLRPVVKKFTRHYDGDMIKISCYGRNNQKLQLTPNHEVRVVSIDSLSQSTKAKFKNVVDYDPIKDELTYTIPKHYNSKIHDISFEWKKIKDVQKGDYLFYPRLRNNIEEITCLNIAEYVDKRRFLAKDNSFYKRVSNQYGLGYSTNQLLLDLSEIKITKEFMFFLGYYVSEGCSSMDGTICFSFHSEEDGYMEEVERLGRDIFGLTFKRNYRKNKNCCTLVAHNVVVAELLRSLCGIGAREKRVPKFIFGLNRKYKAYFIKTLFRGDGSFGKQRFPNCGRWCDKLSYSTGSKQLANDVFDILLEFGILSSIKSRVIEKGITENANGKEYWSVNVTSVANHNKLASVINENIKLHTNKEIRFSICNENFQLLQVKKIEKVEYSGKVYNIGVEDDNSYICENIAVHNCLPYAEASLCGLPVIGTDCSGQSMFLKQDNSYLLEVDNISEIQSGQMQVHYWDGQKFPELKSRKVIDQARVLMREVYENYEEAKKRNEKLRQFLVDNYSIENISMKAKERLDKIWSEIC